MSYKIHSTFLTSNDFNEIVNTTENIAEKTVADYFLPSEYAFEVSTPTVNPKKTTLINFDSVVWNFAIPTPGDPGAVDYDSAAGIAFDVAGTAATVANTLAAEPLFAQIKDALFETNSLDPTKYCHEKAFALRANLYAPEIAGGALATFAQPLYILLQLKYYDPLNPNILLKSNARFSGVMYLINDHSNGPSPVNTQETGYLGKYRIEQPDPDHINLYLYYIYDRYTGFTSLRNGPFVIPNANNGLTMGSYKSFRERVYYTKPLDISQQLFAYGQYWKFTFTKTNGSYSITDVLADYRCSTQPVVSEGVPLITGFLGLYSLTTLFGAPIQEQVDVNYINYLPGLWQTKLLNNYRSNYVKLIGAEDSLLQVAEAIADAADFASAKTALNSLLNF